MKSSLCLLFLISLALPAGAQDGPPVSTLQGLPPAVDGAVPVSPFIPGAQSQLPPAGGESGFQGHGQNQQRGTRGPGTSLGLALAIRSYVIHHFPKEPKSHPGPIMLGNTGEDSGIPQEFVNWFVGQLQDRNYLHHNGEQLLGMFTSHLVVLKGGGPIPLEWEQELNLVYPHVDRNGHRSGLFVIRTLLIYNWSVEENPFLRLVDWDDLRSIYKAAGTSVIDLRSFWP